MPAWTSASVMTEQNRLSLCARIQRWKPARPGVSLLVSVPGATSEIALVSRR